MHWLNVIKADTGQSMNHLKEAAQDWKSHREQDHGIAKGQILLNG